MVELAAEWKERSGLTVALWGDRRVLNSFSLPVAHVRVEDAPMYSLREQIAAARVIREVEPRVFWTPHYPVPIAARQPIFSTVHDLLHLQPRIHGGPDIARRAYARTMLSMTLSKCEAVFAVSGYTASLLRGMRPGAEVVEAKYGIDPRWFSTPAEKSQMPPLAGPYLLYVGNVKPHKNLPRLMEAFALAAEVIPHRLVLAGGAANARQDDLGALDVVHRLGSRVQRMGNLPFDDLRVLVDRADALIIPSLHEGVGLPPLEAMARCTPVIASTAEALRENCGDAVIYVDPYSPREIAEALMRVSSDPGLRKEMGRRGFRHVLERQARVDEWTPLRRIEQSLQT